MGLTGGADYNKLAQNRFIRLTGQGGSVTVASTCTSDVDLYVYRDGIEVVSAASVDGNEQVTFNAVSGTIYIINVQGFDSAPGDYAAIITSHHDARRRGAGDGRNTMRSLAFALISILLLPACATDAVQRPGTEATQPPQEGAPPAAPEDPDSERTAKTAAPVDIDAEVGAGAAALRVGFRADATDVTVKVWGTNGLVVQGNATPVASRSFSRDSRSIFRCRSLRRTPDRALRSR